MKLLWKKVRSRGVSPEAQTLTNEAEMTALQHTLHEKGKINTWLFLFSAIYKNGVKHT